MAGDSSSSSNDSLLYRVPPWTMYCLFTRPSSLIFFTFYITSILLFLPLFILILNMGLQRWRQQRSTSSAAVTSHSDSFTYHMTAIELIGVLGDTLACSSIYWKQINILTFGYVLRIFSWYGKTFFHMLTCLERYLAVVHPVTYLSLRGQRGIRIRNISIGCGWLLCIGSTPLRSSDELSFLLDLIVLIFSVVLVSFCSLSVLCVLIRPGPGQQGGDRERVDQSKRRAFYTILVILGVLSLRCIVSLVIIMLRESYGCVIVTALDWFNVPSSLVLPLLFLHRAGRLSCCKSNT